MANSLTVTSNTNGIAPAIFISTNANRYTLVGNFSYYNMGNVIFFIGSNNTISLDLSTDTATVNGTASLNASGVVTELNKQFIK